MSILEPLVFDEFYAAANTARTAEDEARMKSANDAVLADLKAAMEHDYPIAFSNMAIAYDSGEGVEKAADKAADLYLEASNRVLYCCWVPVARLIIGEEDKYDKASVHRVVGALTQWAAALIAGLDYAAAGEGDGYLTLTNEARTPPRKACIAPGWSTTARAITASTVTICTMASALRSAPMANHTDSPATCEGTRGARPSASCDGTKRTQYQYAIPHAQSCTGLISGEGSENT